jgi:hypothetical protein
MDERDLLCIAFILEADTAGFDFKAGADEDCEASVSV